MELIIHPGNLNFKFIKAFFTYRDIDLLSITNNIPVYIPDQRHTDEIKILYDNSEVTVADGVLTDRKGILIGVRVADCLPILLYAHIKKVIGAVHAGWRGTSKGILKKAILIMRETFKVDPSEILISIGPSIRACCYEVGDEVINLIKDETEGESFIFSVNGKKHIDLVIANIIQAKSLGVREENVWYFPLCTSCNNHIFASYRKEGKSTGRQYGVIGML